MTERLKISTLPIEVNAYAVMSQAVYEGVIYGWTRAFKHAESGIAATAEKVREDAVTAIIECVMTSICEMFQFGD